MRKRKGLNEMILSVHLMKESLNQVQVQMMGIMKKCKEQN